MAIKAGDIVWEIGGDTKGLDKALKHSKKSSQDIGKAFGQASKTLGVGMTAAGATGVAAISGMVKSTLSFKDSIAEVATLGVSDLGLIEDSVKNVAAGLGVDLVDGANAAYQAISAGAKEAEIPKLLEDAAIAATAGMTDLTSAIELGTSVTNAFGGEMSNADQIFDQAFVAVKNGVTTFEELSSSVGKLSPIMSAAGLSTEEMFASIATLTKGGVATSEAVTQIRQVISGVIKPSSEAAELAEQLGVEFNATALEAQGLSGFLKTLSDATGGNLETMGRFFGSTEALGAVLGLTGANAEEFTNQLEAMNSATGSANEALETFRDNSPTQQWKELSGTLKVLAVNLGSALLPPLAMIAEKMRPIVETITNWVQANPKLTASLVIAASAIGAMMAVVGPLLIILPGIVAGISGFIAALGGMKIIGAILLGVGIVMAGFFDSAKQLFEKAKGWVSENWEAIKESFKLAGQTLGVIMSTIGTILGAAFDVLSAIFVGFVGGYASQWASLLDGSEDGSDSLIDTFIGAQEGIKSALEKVQEWVEWFSELVETHWKDIVAGARWVGTNMARPLVGLAKRVWWVAQRIIGAVQTIIRWFNALKNSAPVEWLSKILGFAGGGVVRGFASGGVVSSGGRGHQIVEVGERGREMVALPNGSRVMSHPNMMKAVSQGMNSGGDSINFAPVLNVTVSGAGSDQADQIVQAIKGPLFREMANQLKAARR